MDGKADVLAVGCLLSVLACVLSRALVPAARSGIQSFGSDESRRLLC